MKIVIKIIKSVIYVIIALIIGIAAYINLIAEEMREDEGE
jgi:hypothetical protein